MRSPRVLDVLFTLHAAGDLLYRVAANQAKQAVSGCNTVVSRPHANNNNLQKEPVSNLKAEDSDVVVKVDPQRPPVTTQLPLKSSAHPTVKPDLASVLPEIVVKPQIKPVDVVEKVQPSLKPAAPVVPVKRIIIQPPEPPQAQVVPQERPVPSFYQPETVPAEPVTLEAAPPLRVSRVPASRIGRMFHYGSLVAGLGMGAAGEFLRRTASGGNDSQGSLLMSEANVSRLVEKLSRMRGAALKLGQFLSIQDAHVLPPQIEQIFRRVQNSAHYMPNSQMEKVMRQELGPEWRSKFSSFDPIPIASASIGQVHAATLASNGMPLAVKIQFPAVAESINSDLDNLSMLLAASSLLPKGLFLDSTLRETKKELADECDYKREAACAKRFAKELKDDDRFEIMGIVDEISTSKVLAMQRMDGVPVTRAEGWSQELRNDIGTGIMTLCLRELFHFRFMQTDPNWTNFLYNVERRKIQLIDFGASREYSKTFIDDWLRLLQAAIDGDKEACIAHSRKLGYLTGEENEAMLDAHTKSMVLLGTPFRRSTPQPFDFSSQTITDQIRELIPIMIRNRLTPPPKETYSLNRKLSGAFLLCGRLKANVDCAKIWEEVTGDYKFDEAN